jgi:hypothetical protein
MFLYILTKWFIYIASFSVLLFVEIHDIHGDLLDYYKYKLTTILAIPTKTF